MDRRNFIQQAALASTGLTVSPFNAWSEDRSFSFNYAVPSAMYGDMPVRAILPEISKTGAKYIDLWPKPHGTHREQVKAMGDDAFIRLLEEHEVKLGISTCYKLGPFNLAGEMNWASKVAEQGVTIVCGAAGKKNLKGEALKKELHAFVEKMKPQISVAEKTGCTIAIENHSNSLVMSPDSLRYFAEATADIPQLGLSFAPHHLPQDGAMQGQLIREIGPCIKHFYAQQYGNGSKHKQPWETEMLQMPGRGKLDFKPIVKALISIHFTGFTEIFMHPFPRGVPIRNTIEEITAEINWSRDYLEKLI